jgi:hypothetical protein
MNILKTNTTTVYKTISAIAIGMIKKFDISIPFTIIEEIKSVTTSKTRNATILSLLFCFSLL